MAWNMTAVERIRMANDILAWLEKNDLSSGKKAHDDVIVPFATENNLLIFNVWRGWDELFNEGRRMRSWGGKWQIIYWEKIKLC